VGRFIRETQAQIEKELQVLKEPQPVD